MNNYVPLHAHTTFGSIGDSILKITDYIETVKKYNCPAAAITDHGSMACFVQFYEECKKNNINPLIGCEFYYVDNRLEKNENARAHLILIAKNYNGLKNLIRIHNDASKNGFYYKPRTDLSIINKYKNDLICLSACVSGPLGLALKNRDFNKLLIELYQLKAVFGKDLYLEIQPGHFREQICYNDLLGLLHYEYNIPLVATNDIHYLKKEDCQIHNWHVKDSRHDKNNNDSFVYPDTCYYVMNREELSNNFFRTSILTDSIIEEAMDNTIEIANKCNLELPEEHFMPVFDKNIDEYEVLKDYCLKGLAEKKLDKKEKYLKRLTDELTCIKILGFSGYFLIVKDIIDYCDRESIPRGPGRGSCAGSLISYLLNISVADPIKYNLLFERFLSVKRKAIPDIDLDLSPKHKQKVYDYIIKRYSQEKCCFVSTFNIRKARNAIKTAARLVGISPTDANFISSKIPEAAYDEIGNKLPNITIKEALKLYPDFARLCKRQDSRLIKIAQALEGYPSSVGIHPAGIVISPIDISDRYPLVKVKDPRTKDWRQIMATSLDLNDVEKLSGVKFDLLSLSSLDVIYKTMSDVGVKFDFSNQFLLEDKKVWALISSENNSGLFQISSNTYKTRMPQLHPSTIEELAACLALVRGPCISSEMDKLYIDIVNKKKQEEHIHDIYWNATKETHGVLIYQEQILKICTNIGFNSETAYDILKAVSKKKIDKIKGYEKEFYMQGQEKNIDKNVLDNIWQKILDSGLYCFNKSHAVSYALVCYLSAYLKFYYPVHYMCNLLTKEADQNNKPEVLKRILTECKKFNIDFLPVDINKSLWEFTVEDNKIRIGFSALKGAGESVYNKIKETRNFKNFNDFIERASGRVVNKKPILILIFAGAFSSIENKTNKELALYYMHELRKDKDWDGKVAVGTGQSFNMNESTQNINKMLFCSDLYYNRKETV